MFQGWHLSRFLSQQAASHPAGWHQYSWRAGIAHLPTPAPQGRIAGESLLHPHPSSGSGTPGEQSRLPRGCVPRLGSENPLCTPTHHPDHQYHHDQGQVWVSWNTHLLSGASSLSLTCSQVGRIPVQRGALVGCRDVMEGPQPIRRGDNRTCSVKVKVLPAVLRLRERSFEPGTL